MDSSRHFHFFSSPIPIILYPIIGWIKGAIIDTDLIIGLIISLVYLVYLVYLAFLGFVDGQPFPNRYGPDPKRRNYSPTEDTPTQPNRVDRLRELKKLLDEGILTQEEFVTQKERVLASANAVAGEAKRPVVEEAKPSAEKVSSVPQEDKGSGTLGEDNESCVSNEDFASLLVKIPGKTFAISKYPVTQELWEKVMGGNPSAFKGADRPVENVSWNDCQRFLEKLNSLLSIPGQGFRLPTMEEWQYVCRAGTTGNFCKLTDGSEITKDSLGDVAWYDKNSEGQTHPVGLKKPNAFGLHDMLGNVWEWTSTKRGFGRANCGGSFGSPVCSANTTGSDDCETRNGSLGLRLARDHV